MKPKIKVVVKWEPNKPSQKKGVLGALMLSWEWEKTIDWLKGLFKRKGK